jgi:hypothetical protein
MMSAPKHPAKFSPEVMEAIGQITRRRITKGCRVLDGFAGTGRIHQLGEIWGWDTVGVEIEPEWAAMDPRTIVGDATALPFADRSFRAYITSPVYPNRMRDHHNAQERCKACLGTGLVLLTEEQWRSKMHIRYGDEGGCIFVDKTIQGRRCTFIDSQIIDGKPVRPACEKCGGTGRRSYKRNTYKHTLDRRNPDGTVADLHPNNAGAMSNNTVYWDLHERAWAEATRVTTHWFVLNVSNSIGKGVENDATDRHLAILSDLGWTEYDRLPAHTKRLRHGANHDARVDNEWVIALRR